MPHANELHNGDLPRRKTSEIDFEDTLATLTDGISHLYLKRPLDADTLVRGFQSFDLSGSSTPVDSVVVASSATKSGGKWRPIAWASVLDTGSQEHEVEPEALPAQTMGKNTSVGRLDPSKKDRKAQDVKRGVGTDSLVHGLQSLNLSGSSMPMDSVVVAFPATKSSGKWQPISSTSVSDAASQEDKIEPEPEALATRAVAKHISIRHLDPSDKVSTDQEAHDVNPAVDADSLVCGLQSHGMSSRSTLVDSIVTASPATESAPAKTDGKWRPIRWMSVSDGQSRAEQTEPKALTVRVAGKWKPIGSMDTLEKENTEKETYDPPSKAEKPLGSTRGKWKPIDRATTPHNCGPEADTSHPTDGISWPNEMDFHPTGTVSVAVLRDIGAETLTPHRNSTTITTTTVTKIVTNSIQAVTTAKSTNKVVVGTTFSKQLFVPRQVTTIKPRAKLSVVGAIKHGA